MSKRRKYSDEFKREAVQLTNHPGVSKAQIARELGINPNMLGRWCQEFHVGGEQEPRQPPRTPRTKTAKIIHSSSFFGVHCQSC